MWDTFDAQWEERFRSLKRFHQREGHCRVPRHYREADYHLGEWVHVQRQGKDTMLPERRQRLDALGFVWDTFDVVVGRGVPLCEEVSPARRALPSASKAS